MIEQNKLSKLFEDLLIFFGMIIFLFREYINISIFYLYNKSVYKSFIIYYNIIITLYYLIGLFLNFITGKDNFQDFISTYTIRFQTSLNNNINMLLSGILY